MKKKETIQHIVRWLKKYCEQAGMQGFVVGVSGGIDSALSSTLCALTQMPVVVLNMPILQQKNQYSLAKAHIKWLKKKYKNVSSFDVDLSDSFLKLKETLPQKIQDAHSMANARSRLRMLTLYTVSTHNKMLVAGTGNKVEDFGIGFFTKYGDGGVDLSPLADLMKSEVYALAGELKVLQSILEATPVDGLWADNRTDEQQIGATYEELEKAMKMQSKKTEGRGKKDKRRKAEQLSSREKKVIAIYKKFHTMNEHKMKAIPVCAIPKKLRG